MNQSPSSYQAEPTPSSWQEFRTRLCELLVLKGWRSDIEQEGQKMFSRDGGEIFVAILVPSRIEGLGSVSVIGNTIPTRYFKGETMKIEGDKLGWKNIADQDQWIDLDDPFQQPEQQPQE